MRRKSTKKDVPSDDVFGGFSESDGVQEFATPAKPPKPPKPKAPKDVYTLILLLSFIFFVAATVLLYLDIASYK